MVLENQNIIIHFILINYTLFDKYRERIQKQIIKIFQIVFQE